jgi:hypothetical protein
MKTKCIGLIISSLKTHFGPAFALSGLLLCHGVSAAPTLSITPSSVSNTYGGTITLVISNVPAGHSVTVQKYLDLNTNGLVDAGDWLVQQFNLTDSQAGMVIGGVTNFNVPGDMDGASNGQITAVMDFHNGDFVQNIAGTYLFVLSSPGGDFSPVTNQFKVTNFPYAQTVSGTVFSNASSTPVPDAVVLLFPPPKQGSAGPSGSPLAGVVAGSAGAYTIPALPGTYSLAAFRSNYLANYTTPPVFTLSSSGSLSTNLKAIAATTNISGSVIDASSGAGLPGVLMTAGSSNLAIGFTDANGLFTLGVKSGNWGLRPDDTALIVHGYPGPRNKIGTNAGATGVTFALSQATALVWGRVTNSLGNPLPALDMYANDQNNDIYETDAYTDANGNYVLGVLGFGSSDPWYVQANGDNQLTNYVFSQETIDGNINAGQAVRQDFTASLGTNFITGNVQCGGTNLAGVGVNAILTGSSVNFNAYADTDANGNYSLQVFNGSWNVSVNCSGGSDSLANVFTNNNYVCPGNQTANISNSNAVVDFTVLLGTNSISGRLADNNGNPIANIWVWASSTDSIYNNLGVATDTNGDYSITVVNDEVYNVGVNSGGGNGSLPSSYVPPNSQTVAVTNDNPSGIDFTALLTSNSISGRLTDNNGNPIASVWISGNANINGNYYNTGANTDTNGYYSFGVINSNLWGVGVSGNLPSDYLSPPDQQVPVTNDSPTEVDFVALLATNFITGNVRTSLGTNIPGVGVWASATNSDGGSFTNYVDTDTNGNYSLNVGNGSWTVWLNCGGNYNYSNSLDNILGPNNYVCPANQTVNIANNNATNNFAVEVNCTVITVLTLSPPDGQVGAYYQGFAQAMGCYPPFTWLPFSGSLPPGMMGNTNGEIFGTPATAGTYPFTVEVVDSRGQSTNVSMSLTIVNPLTITTTSLGGGTQSVYYSQQLQGAGGHPPYSWTWSSNTPPGLNLATNGLLSGYPSSTGTFVFSVQASDNYAYLASTNSNTHLDVTNQTLSLTILPLQFAINASAGAGGSIVPSGTNVEVIAGDSQAFMAAPNANYVVYQWLLDGTNVQSGGTNYTLANVQTNHSLEVTFTFATIQETIIASAGTNGVISPSGTFSVAFGSNQVFIATPNSNYAVNQWLVDSNVVQAGGTNYTLADIQTNHSVEVTFLEQFIINASTDGNGAISPSNLVAVLAGSNQVFTATPNANYAVNQWLLDGTNAQTGGANYTLADVQTNHTLEVTFSALAPAQIASLTATSAVGSVTLTWPGFADTSLKYKIYRAQTTNSLTNGGALATISLTNASGQYVDGAGQPGLGYYYAVSAVNSNGAEGAYSTPAAGTNLVVWPQAPTTDLGGSLQLCVTAESTTALSYQWLLNGQKLSDGGLVAGSQASCLTVGGVLSTGQFLVVISSSLGSVTSPPVAVNLSASSIEFVTGTYNGLFYPYPPEEATTANSGAFTLTLAKKGTFSGKVRLADSTKSFTGQFSDTNGFATAKTPGKQGTALPMYLQLDTTPGRERIIGVITNNGVPCGLYAYLAAKSATTAAHYTLAIPPGGTNATALPGGWSAFSASLSGGNTLSLAGTLADGAKVSQSATLASNGDFPLFAPLYKGQGLLMGWLVFTNDTAHGDSALWIKLPGQANYGSGFALVTNVVGSAYKSPVTLTQGVLTLQGGGVSLLLTNGISVVNNKLTSATDDLTIKFNPSAGTFSGSFLPSGHAKVTLNGVLLQQQGDAVGWYLLDNESGSVTIEPPAP